MLSSLADRQECKHVYRHVGRQGERWLDSQACCKTKSCNNGQRKRVKYEGGGRNILVC